MWSLPVLSRGYLLQDRAAEGRIHSVFRRTINILSGGTLITLLDPHFGNTPTGIRLGMTLMEDWRDVLTPGMPVHWRAGVFRCPAFSLALHQVPVWQPRQSRHMLAAATVAAQLSRLSQQLLRYCAAQKVRSQLPLEALLGTGDAPYLLLAESVMVMTREVRQLVGFGTGLTPDGDDFLLGYLAACHLTENRVDPERLQQLCAAIAARLSSTNDISRHYLSLALQGHYAEPVHQLISALSVSATASDADSAALTLLQQGSASGADCLAGLILGLRHSRQTELI